MLRIAITPIVAMLVAATVAIAGPSLAQNASALVIEAAVSRTQLRSTGVLNIQAAVRNNSSAGRLVLATSPSFRDGGGATVVVRHPNGHVSRHNERGGDSAWAGKAARRIVLAPGRALSATFRTPVAALLPRPGIYRVAVEFTAGSASSAPQAAAVSDWITVTVE